MSNKFKSEIERFEYYKNKIKSLEEYKDINDEKVQEIISGLEIFSAMAYSCLQKRIQKKC